MITEQEWSIIKEIKSSRALKDIENLSAIGDRFIGTEGDAKAIEYVKAEFGRIGLEIKETPITVPTFQERSKPVLRVVASDETYDAIPPYFSPSTPPGGLKAEAVMLGGGAEEDYKGKDVEGKIVFIPETEGGYSLFWLGTFAERAANHGAVGMIILHPMPWPYRMSMEAGNSIIANRFCSKQLPALCVSGLDGARLAHNIGAGNNLVEMVSETLIEDRDSVIISGINRGTEHPDKRIGVIGHRDNGIAPGANDNLSGTSTMLELARVLGTKKSKCGYEFICSTAEEGVTIGAWTFCQKNKEDLQKNMLALIDADMFACGGMIKQVEKGVWPDCEDIHQPEWLMNMVDEVAEDLGYYFGRMTAGWGVAESARFLEIGVPATWFWAPDDPYYHSIHDSADKVNPISIKGVADTSAIVMWRLANK